MVLKRGDYVQTDIDSDSDSVYQILNLTDYTPTGQVLARKTDGEGSSFSQSFRYWLILDQLTLVWR